MSRVSKKYWFRRILICFQNYQNQGQSTEGKKNPEKDRNDDKKMKQIRMFLYQLSPIYIIQNSKY